MLSPAVTRTLIDHYAAEPAVPRGVGHDCLRALTAREKEVARRSARPVQRRDRRKLHMSEATVKAHVSRVLTKLNATNRVQVAILMRDAGLT